MTIKDIYKQVKSIINDGVSINDIKDINDLQALAWQYAYEVMKDKRITKALKNDGSAKSITPKWLKDCERYNDMFMGHYTKAIKVLRKAVK
jgi:hypothetical protein